MSKKKKIILFVSLGITVALVAYALFCGIIHFLFNKIQTDPIDKTARAYLYENVVLDESYGKIELIARYVVGKKSITENAAKVPYAIRTETHIAYYYVSLHFDNEQWVADSYEFIRVVERRE